MRLPCLPGYLLLPEDQRPLEVGQGGEMLQVTVAGVLPKLTVGHVVRLVELESIPWATNGRSGVAYKVKDVQSMAPAKA